MRVTLDPRITNRKLVEIAEKIASGIPVDGTLGVQESIAVVKAVQGVLLDELACLQKRADEIRRKYQKQTWPEDGRRNEVEVAKGWGEIHAIEERRRELQDVTAIGDSHLFR